MNTRLTGFGLSSLVLYLVFAPLVHTVTSAEVLHSSLGVFRELRMPNQCDRIPCTIAPTGQTNQTAFTLSYGIAGSSVTLVLNGIAHGPLPVWDTPRLTNGEFFLFQSYRFHDDHRFGLYALWSQGPTADGNVFHHFFARDATGAFHYLGEYGYMSYDERTERFVVLEPAYKEAPPGRGESLYVLQDNAFRCVGGACQ